MQYPHPPKHCDQAQRETPERVNPAEYVQYGMIRLSDTVAGTRGGQGRVSAVRVLTTQQHLWEPPTSAGRGFSHFLGL